MSAELTPGRLEALRRVARNLDYADSADLQLALDHIDAQEIELTAAKSVIVRRVVEISLESSRTVGLAVDKAVDAITAILTADPDLRARQAEATIRRLRALADYWATLADGDKYYAGRILQVLDGGQE